MTEDMFTASILLIIKYKGKLINTSVDVQKICLVIEYVIRMHNDIILTRKNISQILCIKSMNEVCFDTSIFNFNTMKNHILHQDIFDNHRSQLIQLIISYYIICILFQNQ